jgi:hypothetical protein
MKEIEYNLPLWGDLQANGAVWGRSDVYYSLMDSRDRLKETGNTAQPSSRGDTKVPELVGLLTAGKTAFFNNKTNSMKPTLISYQKTFPLAPYVNEKISIEMQLDEGDDPIVVLNEAKKLVEKYHRDTNPQLYQEVKVELDAFKVFEPPIRKEQPKKDRLSQLKEDISTCKELKVLESYRLIAQSNPEIKSVYETMYKKLQVLSK